MVPIRSGLVSAIALLLAGCAVKTADSTKFDSMAASRTSGMGHDGLTSQPLAPKKPQHVLGVPYTIHGRWFRPAHQPEYKARGIATRLGRELNGRRTANGELFQSSNLFAAHPTLPLPSYVEVHYPRTGRYLTVRVNERGAYEIGHVIAVSARAAELLGFHHLAEARVEVRYLSPAPIRHAGRDHDRPTSR